MNPWKYRHEITNNFLSRPLPFISGCIETSVRSVLRSLPLLMSALYLEVFQGIVDLRGHVSRSTSRPLLRTMECGIGSPLFLVVGHAGTRMFQRSRTISFRIKRGIHRRTDMSRFSCSSINSRHIRILPSGALRSACCWSVKSRTDAHLGTQQGPWKWTSVREDVSRCPELRSQRIAQSTLLGTHRESPLKNPSEAYCASSDRWQVDE